MKPVLVSGWVGSMKYLFFGEGSARQAEAKTRLRLPHIDSKILSGKKFLDQAFATRTRELFTFMPSMMAPRPAMFWR